MSYRDTLICTVGTSLKGNLLKMADKEVDAGLAKHNFQGLAARLLQLGPDDRVCGAEINSNHDIRRQGFLDKLRRLVLLVSDTPDGMLVGQILKHYYKSGYTPLRFQEVELQVLEGLTDQDPKRFQKDGLRNLVRAIATEVRHREAHYLIINATGGYKAQISFAGMIGQALEIPVCYLFEQFSEVIELPPQPVALDMSFWLENAGAFYDLDRLAASTDPRVQEPRFDSLVEVEEIDGQMMAGLSAMGQLFHETFRRQFKIRREQILPPDSSRDPKDKVIKYEDDNQGKHRGLAQYLENLLKVPYVTRIYTYKFIRDLPRPNYFDKSAKGQISQVEGGYTDGKATTKFDLVTTADTVAQRDAALADLDEQFL